MCLQTKPSMRPSCEQLLSHPIVLRNGSEVIQFFETLEESNELLGTIKLPKNIKAIAQQLPKPNYEEEMRPMTEAGDRGRSVYHNEEIKQIQAGIYKRPISQNVPLTRNYNLVRESQSRESRIAHMQKVEAVAKKESEKEYLARMQREYIDKAKAIRPLELMKSPKGSDNIAVRQKQPINAAIQKKAEALNRPVSRVKEEVDARNDLYTPGSKARPKILEVRKAAEEYLTRHEPGGLPTNNHLRLNSRDKGRELGGDRLLSDKLTDKQEYLLNKYQNKDLERKPLPRISTPQTDALMKKADYLIQKYQGIDMYRRDGLGSREEVKRNAITPGNGVRSPQIHVDLLDRYKNIYNVKETRDLNPRSPNVGLGVPVKKIDYQYLNQQNNLYVLKKNPSNQDNLAPVRKQTQIKVAVKPVWWG